MSHAFFAESRRNGMSLKALFEKLKTISAAGLLTASFVVAPSVQAANWSGNTGNWSSNSSPGWNGTGVPDAVGAVATKSANNTSSLTTQDVVAGVTVGAIQFTTVGSAINWQITLTNGITLNQDGAGSGTATISNANTGGGANYLSIASGTLTLADDLLISNSGTSTNTLANGGAIRIGSVIAGTGNITIDNVLNNTSTGAGCIRLAGTNIFTGSVNVRSGLTVFTNSSAFGNAANVITLGASGAGSASLMANATATVANNWVVAAGSTGTLTLGSFGTNPLTFNGTGTLNDNITFLTGATDANRMKMNGVISGTGNITISSPGSGFVELGNANTFSGSTIVSSGILRLTNALALQNSALDTTNSVTGTPTAGFQYRPASGTTLTLGGLTGNKNLDSVFATGSGSFSGGYTTITALTLNPGTGVTHTYSAAITNGGNNMTLTKTGLGTQILGGANTYTGATSVQQGVLLVDGSTAAGSAVSVSLNAVLGGTGTVNGTVTVNGGIAPGSTGIGTLTVNNAVTWNGGQNWLFQLDSLSSGTSKATPGTSDLLSLTGAFTKGTGSTFTFDFANSGTDGWYKLANYASTNFTTGTFTSGTQFAGTNLPTGKTATFVVESTALYVQIVPEPGTLVLAGIGLGMATLSFMNRRRRV